MRRDGRRWTISDAIAWQILGELHRANMYERGFLRIKPEQDRLKWPVTPWADTDDDASERVGKVAAADQAAAVDYLVALSAPPA